MNSANSQMPAQPAPMRVGVVVLPDTSMLTLAATLDPMRAANRLSPLPVFDWQIATPDGTPAVLTCGLPVAPTARIKDLSGAALVVVVAGFNQHLHARGPLLSALRRLAPLVGTIAGAEAGAWVLGRAGLLDGHQATTHWEDLEDFAAAFPAIDVIDARYAISGNRLTSGGASPTMDLMLDIIRRRASQALALQVAGAFIYDDRHIGSDRQSLVSRGRLERSDPVVARALALMEAHLEDPLPIAALARALGLSRRALESRFRRALGAGPGASYLGLRVQAAGRLVRDTAHPMQQIALRCGFSSQAVFSRAFRAVFGMAPSAWRADLRQGTRVPGPTAPLGISPEP